MQPGCNCRTHYKEIEVTKEPIQFFFESEVAASPADAWKWISSVKCIQAEMWPYFRMTAPKGIESIDDLDVKPGIPLFRSRVYLFGFLPIDHSDMTLIELRDGEGFIEQSPMGSMKLWRHDRRIVPTAQGSRIVDHLTFEPRWARGITTRFIHAVFKHRHKVIRRGLG
jgi:ligand-binding SRPBCC domain-containing protein